MNAIFERFRNILHDGQIPRRVQYTIEKLFTVRKNKFKDNPGVIQELDLIEEQDKITHDISLDDDFETEDNLNFFKYDPDYEMKETQWDEIKKEILGEYQDSVMQARQQEAADNGGEAGTMIETGQQAGVPMNTQAIDYQKVSKRSMSFIHSFVSPV